MPPRSGGILFEKNYLTNGKSPAILALFIARANFL